MTTGPYGALLDAVRGVRWPAVRRVPGATLGVHASPLRGASSEFSEFRPYRQGDDPRRLDWRLLARSDRAFVRLTTDRASFRTSVIVDGSASMAYPLPGLDKWRHAREIAIGLAAVAHAEGDPVGMLIVRGETVRFDPRARRSVLLEMMRALDAREPDGVTPLAPAVSLARAGRIAVVSDLLGDAEAMRDALRLHCAQGGEATVVHIVAAEELDPPAGAMLAVDPEAPAVRRTFDSDVRDGYRAAFVDWMDGQAEGLRREGIRYVLVTTTEETTAAVRRIVAPTQKSR